MKDKKIDPKILENLKNDDVIAERRSFLEDLRKLDQSPIEIKDRKLSEGFAKPVGNPKEYKSINAPQKVQSADAWKAGMDARAAASAARRGEIEKIADYGTKYKDKLGNEVFKPEIQPGNTLNYKDLLKEKKAINKLDDAKKLLKGGSKLGLAVALPAALMAGSASDAMADVIVPGGVEGLGEGSDMPMQDDTNQIKTYAESATDPNLRRMALQELRNRNR